MSVLVYKTNIFKPARAKNILEKLSNHFPEHKINFDLEDSDKILRMEGTYVNPEILKTIMHGIGFTCEELE